MIVAQYFDNTYTIKHLDVKTLCILIKRQIQAIKVTIHFADCYSIS